MLLAQKYGLRADGTQQKNDYVDKNVGIAAGLFVAAIQTMGLVTLTHTSNPMGFVRELLGRGTNEKAVLMLPVGYPAAGAQVPDLARLEAEPFISGMCRGRLSERPSGQAIIRDRHPGQEEGFGLSEVSPKGFACSYARKVAAMTARVCPVSNAFTAPGLGIS